jgi:hypothetical protein
LIEFRQRQSGAQLEAARGLPPRDGDGGLERFLCRRRVGGLAPEQHFAADAMQFRFERAIAGPVARRQRFVEDRKRAFDIAGASFGFGQRDLDEAVVEQNILFAQKIDAAAHVREPVAGRAAFKPRQALEEDPKRSPKW